MTGEHASSQASEHGERVSYRDKLAEAIYQAHDPLRPFNEDALTDAALSVRDAELDRLSQENDRLRARLTGIAVHINRLDTWIHDDKASITIAGAIVRDLMDAFDPPAAGQAITVDRDTLVDILSRCRVERVTPVDGEVKISAESFADAIMTAALEGQPPAEKEEDPERCGHIRVQWDGSYRMTDRCTSPAGRCARRGAHGPWEWAADEPDTDDHDPATLRPGEPPTKVHTIPLPEKD